MIKRFKEFLSEEENQLKKYRISVLCSHPQTNQHHVEKIEKVLAPDSESALGVAKKRFWGYGYDVHSVWVKE